VLLNKEAVRTISHSPVDLKLLSVKSHQTHGSHRLKTADMCLFSTSFFLLIIIQEPSTNAYINELFVNEAINLTRLELRLNCNWFWLSFICLQTTL